jgi:Na+/glutamate symporter
LWTTINREEKKLTIPIWIYAVVAGIVISALMAIKTGREERQLEMENIEREGEIYMKRLEKEKEMRKEVKATSE